MSGQSHYQVQPARLALIWLLLALAAGLLLWRVVDLHIFNQAFLQGQGDARHLRVVPIPAHRGMLTDRHGEPLAVSAPVDSVWANPRDITDLDSVPWARLGALLELSGEQLRGTVAERAGREFVYLRRHVNPDVAAQVQALNIPGIALQREYRRFYPHGSVAAHLVGFTDIDQQGQEGMERMLEQRLRGVAGARRVERDRHGRIIGLVEAIREPRSGENVALSIDRRIQYLAYRELKLAVQRHQARSGSAVVLDVQTGEVLAMVNQPAYNPNNRGRLSGEQLRNRAVTDIFEPGSTIKPFTAAAALETGRYRPDSVLETAPGVMRVGSNTVRDIRNFGTIDVAQMVSRSSNIGAARLALDMPIDELWSTLHRVGFGQDTLSGFPGESGGTLESRVRWSDMERATLAFGYGLNVTTLQLAQAYRVLAGDGQLRPISFLRVDEPEAQEAFAQPVLSAQTVEQVRQMLEQGISGTGASGRRAAIPGYRVGGKTGTARLATRGGYHEDRYRALFVGMAPMSEPRLVMAVVIEDPTGGEFFGGAVAAPVFQAVISGALRLMNIAPDDIERLPQQPWTQAEWRP